MKLLALLSLLPALAWALTLECEDLSVKTSKLSLRAMAGRTSRFTVKVKGPCKRAAALPNVVLRMTLPPGVTLKSARVKSLWRHKESDGGSLEERGQDLHFWDVFAHNATSALVFINVLVDEYPPATLSVGIASYVGETGKCYTTHPPKILTVDRQYK